jgi:hypothetical protein
MTRDTEPRIAASIAARGRAPVRARGIAVIILSLALSATALVAVTAPPAFAYCTTDATRWQNNTVTLHGYGAPPMAGGTTASYRSAVASALGGWNNISESSLHYNAPLWDASASNPPPAFQLFPTDFSNAGLPDVPGITLGFLSHTETADHSRVIVLLNTDFSWYTTGVHNPDLRYRDADVWTVAMHEFGHAAGLAHPDQCGLPLSAAESDAVMNPNGELKHEPNDDDKRALRSRY